MKKPKRSKTFSCSQECESNCCSFITLRGLEPRGGKFDEEWFELHKVEHVERELSEDSVKEMEFILKANLDKAKTIPNMFRKQIEPAILQMMQLCLKEHWFKIPVPCNKLGKDGKCNDYDNRPKVCKTGNGGKEGNPFKINKCPY